MIHPTEEVDPEEAINWSAGFDREYGHSWQSKPSASSTPTKGIAATVDPELIVDEADLNRSPQAGSGSVHVEGKQEKKETPTESSEQTYAKTVAV